MQPTHSQDAPGPARNGWAGRAPATAGYRPEIDGLRAFAVVPVIFFHAKFAAFSGGFVGVDVFFVISGYLITGICLREIGAGNFSLLRFFERRARRILPALFAVIAVSLPFGWAWMLPDPFENFGQSVVASTLSANNILLLLTSGYWDLAAEFKPLLHTWSLAVEEQFYIFFPPLLWLLMRFAPRAALPALLIIALVSLAASEVSARAAPTANFYLLHTRAWELLAGSFCAFSGRRTAPRTGTALALLGLALILVPMTLFDGDTPFPSVYALAPVGGTVLVILYASGNAAARLLSLPPFIAIGWISYSLYLWHQPVFAFARVRSTEEPSTALLLVLIVLVFALSVLSYRYVERPFRDRRRVPLRLLVTVLGGLGVALCAAGAAIHATGGFPARGYQPDAAGDFGGMYITYNERVYGYQTDAFPENGNTNVLVAGNSVARDFVNMLVESGADAGKNVVYRYGVRLCFSRLPGGIEALGEPALGLLRAADVVFFPSILPEQVECLRDDAALLRTLGVERVYFVGPKNFGYNLNAYMHVPLAERPSVGVRVDEATRALNDAMRDALPPEAFIDLLALLGVGDEGRVRIFDDAGSLLTPDQVHLTRPGAAFLGAKLFDGGQLDGF